MIVLLGIVADYDVLQLVQLRLYVIMLAREVGNPIIIGRKSGNKAFHIGEDHLVLVFHMPSDFSHILIVELEYQEGDLVCSGTVYGLKQIPLYHGKLEVKEI